MRHHSSTLALGLTLLTLCAGFSLSSSATELKGKALSGKALTDAQYAKAENIAEGRKLNGEVPKVVDSKTAQQAKETASVVNQVPGVKVQPKDLEAPQAAAPIRGFHPIKKLLQPVENLEGMTVKLEQQIMKLEGPIAALQPPMIGLQKKMVKVDNHIGGVDAEIAGMHSQLNSMKGELVGVRSDLAAMRQQISALQEPIVGLKKPISGVAKPLESVQTQLNLILMAIVVAAGLIAVGTPIAAIIIYRKRHKIFKDLNDRELPRVATTSSGRR